MTLVDVAGENLLDIVGRAIEGGKFDRWPDAPDGAFDSVAARARRQIAAHVHRDLRFRQRFFPVRKREGHARRDESAVRQKADERGRYPELFHSRPRAEPDFPAETLLAAVEALPPAAELRRHPARDVRVLLI